MDKIVPKSSSGSLGPASASRWDVPELSRWWNAKVPRSPGPVHSCPTGNRDTGSAFRPEVSVVCFHSFPTMTPDIPWEFHIVFEYLLTAAEDDMCNASRCRFVHVLKSVQERQLGSPWYEFLLELGPYCDIFPEPATGTKLRLLRRTRFDGWAHVTDEEIFP